MKQNLGFKLVLVSLEHEFLELFCVAIELRIVPVLLAPMAIETIKILVAVLELPSKQHCEFSPFKVRVF